MIFSFSKNIRSFVNGLWALTLVLTLPVHAQSRLNQDSSIESYNPAVLKLIYSINKAKPDVSFLDSILIPVKGEPVARRLTINPKDFTALLSQFYSEVASLRLINTNNSNSPARRLHDVLIGPLDQEIKQQNITTLLISANSGLQAVPFAALHDGHDWFGSRYSFSLTPSLSLMQQKQAGTRPTNKALLAGATTFDGLAPLPMVKQEIGQIAKVRAGNVYLNEQFKKKFSTHSRTMLILTWSIFPPMQSSFQGGLNNQNCSSVKVP